MSKKIKIIICGLVGLIVGVGVILFFMNNKPATQIEDTNGGDDKSLISITDKDIVGANGKAAGVKKVKLDNADRTANLEFSSDKFTGIYQVFYNKYDKPSKFELNLSSFDVSKGNFKMVVIHNDVVVATFVPGDVVTYKLEDITGTISLRIAGESAAFKFYMSNDDYNKFLHD